MSNKTRSSHQLLTPDEHLIRLTKTQPNHIYLKQIKHRKFVNYTFSEVTAKALSLAIALKRQGAQPEDKIAIISKNCAEWFIYDFACMFGHFISVPIFPTAKQETITHCLTHSNTHFLVIGKLDQLEDIDASLKQLPHIKTIALSYNVMPFACHYQFDNLVNHDFPDISILKQHNEHDVMSIVYTSGTSGPPKGVMLTYGSFSWSVNQLTNMIGITNTDRMFSYLPLSHITERVYVLGISIETGLTVAFSESLDTFVDDVKMQRPTLFISVPRLWALFQQRILEKIPQKKLTFLLKVPFLHSIIKKKIAQGLGLDKARILGCGSAPVSPKLLKWYHNVGLPICEAWGMTETYAFGSLNYPYNRKKLGSIGVAASGVSIHQAVDGEILIESKGLFSGYYKQEKETTQALTSQGWLKTGDIGKKDSNGYWYIQGRKKDTFKTAKGKFVSPLIIEKYISEKIKVESLCLIGPGLPMPILLIVPYHFQHMNKLRYEQSVLTMMKILNETLHSHEKIKGIMFIKEPWSIENGILTPTLKIKRHELEKRYHDRALNWPDDKIIIWE